MQFSDESLLEWNRMGLIPGPNESQDIYIQRVNYCLRLMETLPKEHGSFIPGNVMEQCNTPAAEEAWSLTRKLYDIAPTWTPIFYSNHELAPWHGGCAWIFQTSESSPLGALFQLRRVFKDKSSFLGIYKRKVLLAHEAVHVARMAYEEPKFEELIAYQTSDNILHKYLGSFVETSKEAALFVLALFMIAAINIGTIGFGFIPQWLVWLNILPLILFVLGLGRVLLRQYQYRRCLQKLSEISNHPHAIICRLTDSEIISFGKKTDLRQYLVSNKNAGLRERVIASYLDNTHG